MAVTTLKVLASLLQMHGPGATVQSDHQGLDALLTDLRLQQEQAPQETARDERSIQETMPLEQRGMVTEAYFRRGGFMRGPYAGGFRRAGGYYPGYGAFRRGGGYYPPGGFRRGGFLRGY